MLRLAALLIFVAGCFPGASGDGVHVWDVRGNYALTYDDRLTLQLSVAGAVRHATAGSQDVVNFGDVNGQPLMLDLGAFCARPDVVCPSESFAPRVSINQTNVANYQPQHLIDVVGEEGVHYGGIVDHTKQDTFVVGLAGSAAANSNCASLSLSVATGRFSHRGESVSVEPVWQTADGGACSPGGADGGSADCTLQTVSGGVVWPADAPVDGIADGQIATGWLGACAFAGLAADATLTVSTGFVGSRTGDYDPPAPIDASADDAEPELDASLDSGTSD